MDNLDKSTIDRPAVAEDSVGSGDFCPGAHPAKGASVESKPRILCVDDDENILDGFCRHLRKSFHVYTATSGKGGLELIATTGAFPLVVSDFKMPGMNGIQFLSQVRAISPDSVRIMLTGQADTTTAISAVNQGNIFRFLVKPCVPMVLERILEAAMDQYRLVVAERQLTQETLVGCVTVLVEVLSILKPEAFSRATRICRYVKFVAAAVPHSQTWQWEVAAMLSQLGWITLPPHLVDKAAGGETMSQEDQKLFAGHAAAAARILEKVPRLDRVAHMIENHTRPFRSMRLALDWKVTDSSILGSLALRAAVDFDKLRHGGKSHPKTIEFLRSQDGEYCPQILDILSTLESTEAQQKVLRVPVPGLVAGMIAEEDIRNDTGIILLTKGQEVTAIFAQRLSNCAYSFAPGYTCAVRLQEIDT